MLKCLFALHCSYFCSKYLSSSCWNSIPAAVEDGNSHHNHVVYLQRLLSDFRQRWSRERRSLSVTHVCGKCVGGDEVYSCRSAIHLIWRDEPLLVGVIVSRTVPLLSMLPLVLSDPRHPHNTLLRNIFFCFSYPFPFQISN